MKEIKLTQGKVALVDDEDFDRVNQFEWFVGNGSKTHASRALLNSGPKRERQMHRFIMNAPPGMCVDHIDGNGFNNCRSNLRVCTQSQNNKNRRIQKHSSPYKGVCWHKKNRKWVSCIRVETKRIYLGSFHNAILAAVEYDLAALKHFGLFAKTNFQMGVY